MSRDRVQVGGREYRVLATYLLAPSAVRDWPRLLLSSVSVSHPFVKPFQARIVENPCQGTPSMRDIVFHTQWCAILCMVAVQWPDSVCASDEPAFRDESETD